MNYYVFKNLTFVIPMACPNNFDTAVFFSHYRASIYNNAI